MRYLKDKSSIAALFSLSLVFLTVATCQTNDEEKFKGSLKSTKQSLAQRFEKAKILQNANKLDEACKIYEELMQKHEREDPTAAQAWLEYASIKTQQGDSEKAVEIYRESLLLFKHVPWAIEESMEQLAKLGVRGYEKTHNDHKITGELTSDEIMGVLRKHLSEIPECYVKEFAKDPSLSGRIVMQWTINNAGVVSSVSAKSNTFESEVVSECMKSMLQSWEFPKPHDSGEVVVTHPFSFGMTIEKPL